MLSVFNLKSVPENYFPITKFTWDLSRTPHTDFAPMTCDRGIFSEVLKLLRPPVLGSRARTGQTDGQTDATRDTMQALLHEEGLHINNNSELNRSKYYY